MEFLTAYVLIGAVIVLPSVDELTMLQIVSVILTWPIVIALSIWKFIKGDA
jgi:hypothetical protein